MNEEDFMHETEMSMAKIRWEKHQLLGEKLKKEEPVTEEEQELFEKIEAES